jgi:cysteinyl-tRNA synthetase
MMHLYNTLSGKKDLLPGGNPLRLFVCGPTVYAEPHIGNARTFMVFDIFAHYLRSRGHKLLYLQNITDIDDKIIDRAHQEGVSWKIIARRYENVFRKDMRALGISSVSRYARASDFIREIVVQVETLVKKGNAYKIEGDGYYFDLTTFPDYGKLSHRTISQAEDAVSRIDISDRKRNRGDFALWKFPTHEHEPRWKTRLGEGRPGWHIEDTAITENFFGPQYEIHGGAMDLKFPHHEAEIAQQESASGKSPLVKLWMHTGFLTVNGEKMSKSSGNFLTVEAMLKSYSPAVFRMMVLMHHYRSPLDYTSELAENAKKNISSIGEFVSKLRFVSKKSLGKKSLNAELDKLTTDFNDALADDFNTTKALAALFGFINSIQPGLWEISATEAKTAADRVKALLGALGLDVSAPKIPFKIKWLARRRELYRKNKQFEQSDALRKNLERVGFVIEDTPLGPFLWPRTQP